MFALLIGRWGADLLGPQGAVLGAFAAGLADAHAGSVAAATLAAAGDITADTALVAIAAALGSNLLVKIGLAFAAGGRRFGLGFLAAMAVPTLAFGAALAAHSRLADRAILAPSGATIPVMAEDGGHRPRCTN